MTHFDPAFTVRSFVGAGGVRLSGAVGGVEGAPVVVFLHGGGQTRRSWEGAARAFAARGYCVINLDARGHGDSEWAPDGCYKVEVQAADLRAVLADITAPIALVGASMGGITALHRVGSGPPPAVTALVMVDIVPRIETLGAERIKSFMRAHRDGFATLDEAAQAVAAYSSHRQRPKDNSGLMANLRQRDDGRLYWHWDPRLIDGPQSIEPPDFSDDLLALSRRITTPVMLVRGLLSDVVSEQGIAEFRAVVPHLEVWEVPQAGHMVAGDRNDAFNQGVLSFLEQHMKVGKP